MPDETNDKKGELYTAQMAKERKRKAEIFREVLNFGTAHLRRMETNYGWRVQKSFPQIMNGCSIQNAQTVCSRTVQEHKTRN